MLPRNCFGEVQLEGYVIFFDLIRILLYIFISHFADAEVQYPSLPSTATQ